MKKLEIGCGDRPTEGFLHQDIIALPGVELDFICQPYEIPGDNYDLIIAVGVMEHLRFEDVKKTLQHFLNILKERGMFLFDVPNLQIWCHYYMDSCFGLPTPFTQEHILNTIYGWQRWPGDEHKSGWTPNSLFKLVDSIRTETSHFLFTMDTADMYTKLKIHRNRFDRPEDAHIYLRLTKVTNDKSLYNRRSRIYWN